MTFSGFTTKVPLSMAARMRATLEMDGSDGGAEADVDTADVPERAGDARPSDGPEGRAAEGILGGILGMAIPCFRRYFTKLEGVFNRRA